MRGEAMKNPAAFPTSGVVIPDRYGNHQQQGACEGMTLRDYFAAKALQEMMHFALLKPQVGDCASAAKAACRYAKGAYIIADAMLEAREPGNHEA